VGRYLVKIFALTVDAECAVAGVRRITLVSAGAFQGFILSQLVDRIDLILYYALVLIFYGF
jgi:hypothetical protein